MSQTRAEPCPKPALNTAPPPTAKTAQEHRAGAIRARERLWAASWRSAPLILQTQVNLDRVVDVSGGELPGDRPRQELVLDQIGELHAAERNLQVEPHVRRFEEADLKAGAREVPHEEETGSHAHRLELERRGRSARA
eukprot:6803977-Prymnesium_polylepis.1